MAGIHQLSRGLAISRSCVYFVPCSGCLLLILNMALIRAQSQTITGTRNTAEVRAHSAVLQRGNCVAGVWSSTFVQGNLQARFLSSSCSNISKASPHPDARLFRRFNLRGLNHGVTGLDDEACAREGVSTRFEYIVDDLVVADPTFRGDGA